MFILEYYCTQAYTHHLLNWFPLYLTNFSFFIDINECVKSIEPFCLNNGVCVNTEGSYICNCTKQYTGVDCRDGE